MMTDIDPKKIRVIALDLDGTLTQHKSPLDEVNRGALDALSARYHLLMVGAGKCERIFRQMGEYPIDIIGNYGLEAAKYDPAAKNLRITRSLSFAVDRERVEERIGYLRKKYGFLSYRGQSVEYHPSGCVTFAILGTEACIGDKLAFDPDRSRRRRMYDEVAALFPEYTVFVGGSSSFDMAPKPYNKLYALDLWCREKGLSHGEVLFVGDDYGKGGNDESVYLSDVPFLPIDDYRQFPKIVAPLLVGNGRKCK